MSAKPLNGRRVVPVIPRQLDRRAKDSKNDRHQINGKSVASPAVEEGANIGKEQEKVSAPKPAETAPAPAPEPVAEPVKTDEVLKKKQTNGVSHQEVLARPFVPQQQQQQQMGVNDGLVFGGVQDSSNVSPAPLTNMVPPPPLPLPPPVAAMAPHYPPHDNFYANAPQYAPTAWMPLQMNGHAFAPSNGVASMSPSPSHSSIVLPGGSGVVTPDIQASQHHHRPSFPVPPMENNARFLIDFLLLQFGNSEFADYVLDLSSPSKHMMLPVHLLMLARCPTLLAKLHQMPHRRDSSGPMMVQLPQDVYFHDANAFADALRYLYGGQLIDPSRVLHGIPPPPASGDDPQGLVSRMRYALSYLATGHSLVITDITAHGFNMASRLVTWDTLEPILLFNMGRQASDDGLGMPMYGNYATRLLHQAVEFLVHSISPDFTFDFSAPELMSLPRLPVTHRRPRPDSRSSLFATPDAPPTQRLSGIRFGQAPPPDSDLPYPTRILSSVFLSMPFNMLKAVLEHFVLAERLGREPVFMLAKNIVGERERRRADALDALQDKTLASDVLLWEESAWPDPIYEDISRANVRIKCSHVP